MRFPNELSCPSRQSQTFLGSPHQLSDLGPLLIQRQTYEVPQCPFRDDTHWQGIAKGYKGRRHFRIKLKQARHLGDPCTGHIQFVSEIGS